MAVANPAPPPLIPSSLLMGLGTRRAQFYDDMQRANTAPGAVGAPKFGTWALTGAGFQTVQVQSNRLISPVSTTYVYATLGAAPVRIGGRFRFESATYVPGSTALAIVTSADATPGAFLHMIHPVVTPTVLGVTSWTPGNPNVPLTVGATTTLALALDHDYQLDAAIDVANTRIQFSILDVGNGRLLNLVNASDANIVAAQVGTLFWIEPTPGMSFSEAYAY